mgnify:CR=1 FL=1
MADKKENLIEEEVKETKKATRKKVLRAQPRSQEKARKAQKLNLQKKKKHRLFRKNLWKNAGEYLQLPRRKRMSLIIRRL